MAAEKGVDAIHPGYGFLSENPALPRACERPESRSSDRARDLLDLLGDKTAARRLAEKAKIPTIPGTRGPDHRSAKAAKIAAARIGFPLIIKAAFGGGGRGMRVVERPDDFAARLQEARQEAGAAFGNDAVFLERYIRRAKHIEVQILGDKHGNILHLYERDCSVQRRHQKVVEVAPAVNLDPRIRRELADAAVKLARTAGYYNAGTVEFLVDADTGEWFFIEVNPRVQVEHTVTEMVTGIDVVRSQISIAQGHDTAWPCNATCRSRTMCRCTASRCNAALRPKILRTASCRITAGFRRIARPRDSASGWMAHRRMAARSSLRTTIRCW